MNITEQMIWAQIRQLALFPHGKICKHFVMVNLVEMMEKEGIELNAELVKAMLDADDSKILDLIPQPVNPQS